MITSILAQIAGYVVAGFAGIGAGVLWATYRLRHADDDDRRDFRFTAVVAVGMVMVIYLALTSWVDNSTTARCNLAYLDAVRTHVEMGRQAADLGAVADRITAQQQRAIVDLLVAPDSTAAYPGFRSLYDDLQQQQAEVAEQRRSLSDQWPELPDRLC